MFVEIVSARDDRGLPYIKAIVDRDEPLTLVALPKRNSRTENYIVQRVMDTLD